MTAEHVLSRSSAFQAGHRMCKWLHVFGFQPKKEFLMARKLVHYTPDQLRQEKNQKLLGGATIGAGVAALATGGISLLPTIIGAVVGTAATAIGESLRDDDCDCRDG